MSAKFVTSGKGVVERVLLLVNADDACLSYVDIRREAHSMKGAASTIGAMQLSQAALDLQLAAEGEFSVEVMREHVAALVHHFELAAANLPAASAEDEAKEESKPPGDQRGQRGFIGSKDKMGAAMRGGAAGKRPSRPQAFVPGKTRV